MSLCRGVASNALLMSNVIRSVLSCGFVWLMPSDMCCVCWVSNVLVECSGLKPCCVGERGMCGVIMLSIRRSIILDGVQSSVMGLCDAGSVGGLLGLGNVMMEPCFHMEGILQCDMLWLKMFVRARIPSGPKCFRW